MCVAVVMSIVAGLMVLGVRPALASPVTITLEIFSVNQLENPDGDGSDGDYFPQIRIGNGPLETRPRVEDDVFEVNWVFTHTVDSAEANVPITIRLWDYDDFLAGGDDLMDISPIDQDVELNLFYNLAAGTWTGDTAGITIAEGDGDHGFPAANDGRRARILFDISTKGGTDIDGDGIPDTVERFGVRRPDGSVVFNAGMDPCRKNILMQLDFMTGAADGHSHQPTQPMRDEVTAAFNAAPVNAVSPCPYGGPARATGVGFVFIPGTPIAERPVMGFDDGYRAARGANFDRELRPYAHYGIFVHDHEAGSSSSGLCCDDEKDIIVSLGSWRTTCVVAGANGVLNSTPSGDDNVAGTTIAVGPNRTCNSTASGDDVQIGGTGPASAFVGTVRDQSGSVMHELGHALGLGHGGSEGTNYKPNYLSVMNYAFDPGGIVINGAGAARLDYSRQALLPLNKGALSEAAGIGDGTDFTTWRDSSGAAQFGRGNGPLNWNGSTDAAGLPTINPGTVLVNINALDGGGPAVLTGFDDWSNLKYRAVAAVVGAGVAVKHGGDITFPEVLRREIVRDDFFDPDLAAANTVDKADAQAGDALAYQVEVRNVDTGTATSVKVTDTFPDGTSVTREVADIAAGRSRTEAFTYLVPCSTADGSVLTNRAAVSATDRGGSPESNTANNAAQASTTVHAPKLTLGTTATPAVNAGEAITYRTIYRNVGSTSATGVTATDTLPAEVYYSQVLDLGAGPKPNSVTRNSDGTTTLTWDLGTVAAGATGTIEYTARPSLLFTAGESVQNSAVLTFRNANACVYAPVAASASSGINSVTPDRKPEPRSEWRRSSAPITDELLARVQATDQRYDGADGSVADGQLSSADASAALAPPDSGLALTLREQLEALGLSPYVQPRELRQQLISLYLNLGARHLDPSLALRSRTAEKLGLATVEDAARFAQATLGLPVTGGTKARYDDISRVLRGLNDTALLRLNIYI